MSHSPTRSKLITSTTSKRVPLSVLSLSILAKTSASSTRSSMASPNSAAATLLPSPFVPSTSHSTSPRRSSYRGHRRQRSITPVTQFTAPGPLTTRYDNPAGLYSPRTLSRAATIERDSPARRMMDRDESETLQDDNDEEEDDDNVGDIEQGHERREQQRTPASAHGTPPRRLLDLFLQGASPELKRAVSTSAESTSKSPSRHAGSELAGEAPDMVPTWTFFEDSLEDQEERLDRMVEVDMTVDDLDSEELAIPPSNENAPPTRTDTLAMPPPPAHHRHRRSTSLLSQSSATTTFPSFPSAEESRRAASAATTPTTRSPASSSTVAQHTPSPTSRDPQTPELRPTMAVSVELEPEVIVTTPTRSTTPPVASSTTMTDMLLDQDEPVSSFADVGINSFSSFDRPMELLPSFEMDVTGSSLYASRDTRHRDKVDRLEDSNADEGRADSLWTRFGAGNRKRPSDEGPGAGVDEPSQDPTESAAGATSDRPRKKQDTRGLL